MVAKPMRNYYPAEKAFINSAKATPERTQGTLSDLVAELNDMPDGARYAVGIKWNTGGAHIFTAERINGETIFVDPQSDVSDCYSYFDRGGSLSWFRTDTLSPSAIIDLYMEAR